MHERYGYMVDTITNTICPALSFPKGTNARKVISGCTHFLYCSVLSLDGKVNTDGFDSLTWNPFSQDESMKYSGHRKLLCEFSKLSKLNAFLLLGSDTKRTLMHLFLFTNSAQRELV